MVIFFVLKTLLLLLFLRSPQVCGEQCCARWTASSSTKPKKCTKREYCHWSPSVVLYCHCTVESGGAGWGWVCRRLCGWSEKVFRHLFNINPLDLGSWKPTSWRGRHMDLCKGLFIWFVFVRLQFSCSKTGKSSCRHETKTAAGCQETCGAQRLLDPVHAPLWSGILKR